MTEESLDSPSQPPLQHPALSMPESPLLVVGVGGAAGSREALREFLAALSQVGDEPTGLALMLALEPDPAQDAELLDQIRAISSLRVSLLQHGQGIQPESLYVVPADVGVTFDAANQVQLERIARDDARDPVDRLFGALSQSFGARSVGIVLSGAGTDGTLGMQAIANAGGMTAVQTPTNARFDSMPRSALGTGVVDHVLDPASLAQVLTAYAGHVQQLIADDAKTSSANVVVSELRTICELLRDATDHDFRHYKTSTLLRRIQRRMQVTQVSSAGAYVERLREDPAEVSQLFRELLIGVTAFFRDPQAYEALREQVITPLLAERKSDRVRVWVPGCATGEEAYSLAIVFHEALQALPNPPQLQIFATDIDERALSVGRLGIYPSGIEQLVSKERLERYFIKRGKRYEVVRELRELCLFTPHNLINDPPFSRLDLVSCRNLLIYFGPHLQAKLVPLFHYALRSSGYLFLGHSENITSHDELFEAVDAKHCIFQRKDAAVRLSGLFTENSAGHRNARATEQGEPNQAPDLHLLMQRMLLDEFTPKAVIVTSEGKILSASGSMERYLTVSEGTFQNNVVRLARPSLRLALRAALKEASETKRRIVSDKALLPLEAAAQRVRMTVQPMPRLGEEDDLFLVVFEDMGLIAREDVAAELYGRESNIVIEQLEKELAGTRDQLEQTIQDLEVANAELKSSNQELLAMNEELRSANEELEISKEDVHERNKALATAHTVLANLMSSTAIATIFLDEERRIQSYTPAATQFYNLQPSDVGRPIAHVTHRADHMPPLPDPVALIGPGTADEQDVKMGERSFLRRVHPYTNHDGKAEGVVVNFMDVTALKHAIAEARQHRQQLELITDALPVMISYVDASERYRFNNAAYESWFGVSRAQLLGRHIREILGETAYNFAQPYVRRALAGETTRYEAELTSSTQGTRSVLADYVPDIAPDGRVRGYFSLKQDITESRKASLALAEAKRAAEAANLAKSDFLANMSHEIRTPMSAILGYADLLFGQLDDPDNLACLEAIRRNGQHLIELLNDILDLSKIEAGMLEAELLRFAPDKLLREVVEDARLRANERGLSLELTIDGPLPQSIQSDPTRLRQILLNLLSNAIKFTERGGVRVRSRLRPEACQLEISVSDTGIGIPEEIAQQLFEPFMQADTSITRRYGGTGLGLTITKRLVQLLGGEIIVHNEPEGGTTFVFTVATGPLDSVPLTSVDTKIQHYTAEKVSVQGARVLVVDDRRDMRYLLQTFLEEAGAHVSTAANGRDALDKLHEQSHLDAIVLDMQMPEMDGFAAARRLRELGYRGKLIALTASAMTSDRERCIAAGCDEYMSKPVDRARLLALIAQAAEASAQQAAESGEQTRRVLIVDDNEDASEVLSQLLARGTDRLEVSTAASGSEALAMVRELAPHVVILDLGLPDLDGYEVLAQLRALPELGASSFIALTGRASSAEQARAVAAGFGHYFVKPADLEALRRAVRAAG